MPSSDSEDSRTSSILQTAKAFESQIDLNLARNENNEHDSGFYTVMSALVSIRSSMRQLASETKIKKVKFGLIEDDACGWPRLRLFAKSHENTIASLEVGAADRREGVIIYFKESSNGSSVELIESEYQDMSLTDKTLRVLVRSFFESIKKVVSEKESIQRRVASVLQILPEEGLELFDEEDRELSESDDSEEDEKNKDKGNSLEDESSDPFDTYDFFEED